MSAAPNPNDLPPDTDKLIADAARFLPIGAAAMLARIVMSQEPVSFGWIARRMFFAAVTACLVGWATDGYIHSEGLRFAAVGASGYAAPEVADFAIKWLKARGNVEMAKVTGKIKTKKK
jgi:hypothetical protein